MNKKNSLFHIGPQKSGTTWLYQALKHHPDICAPEKDSIHFFDINYNKSESWYEGHFKDKEQKSIFDPTFSYIRNESAPERIKNYDPKAKILLTARNPIERAFSHYWHEKKKDRFNFCFEEVFVNYDLFENWIEPGMYSMHYKRFLEFFPKEQIKILFFEDLQDRPQDFFEEVCEFYEINSAYTPDIIHKKVNIAGAFKSRRYRKIERLLRPVSMFKPFFIIHKKLSSNHIENLLDVDVTVKNNLIDIFYNDISQLEEITGRDLSKWKAKYEK